MQIVISHQKGRVPVTVFHVQGEVTAGSYEQLQQQAEAAVQGGARHLLLDLSDVTFFSSSGLRAMHHIFTLLRTDEPQDSDAAVRQGLKAGTYRSAHLKLLKPSRPALQALKEAGFDMFLEVHSDLQEAVDSF